MNDPTNQRKLEHIHIAANHAGVDRERRFFDAIHLRHRALPEINLKDVSTECRWLGRDLRFPLIISAITGGHHEITRKINHNLAVAAQQTGVAMCVGSQRVMFTHPEAAKSFSLRAWAPDVPLLANLGAVQLNYGFGLPECLTAIECMQADGLCFHLNPLQEAIQHEGDVNFAGLLDKIGELIPQLPVSVIIKEVGHGLDRRDVEQLSKSGIRYFDVAGTGGTSWSIIEGQRGGRAETAALGECFSDWGTPTPQALRALSGIPDVTLIASGGIRSGIDMCKAMVLGASLCGIAGPLLKPAMQSSEAVVRIIEKYRRAFQTAMFLTGNDRLDQLIGNTSLLQACTE
ncbi:MAG: type 2 isopentenyl-diphosphate Delta-isomerase [Spartobacteria bacterium]|nr:type 2 isopentenyl-diphosphate Delta-isomerase [Spartobacteria bacterium]